MHELDGRPLDGGVEGLADAYRRGLTPSDVVRAVLERIDAADDPAIWIDVEPAEDLQRRAKELAAGDPERRPPLWGIPFAVKDNIDVAGRTTTAGLPGAARRAEATAPVVQRLLDAGALYVGKTNLDQLATGLVGTRSPYGTPRNPLDPALVPGGSSSGSAVAVARRQVVFSLGTDTAGSGRVPAAMCGIVGLKGVPGSLPTEGVVPASPTIDCVSTFARTVADALAVEAVLRPGGWPVAAGPLTVAGSPGSGPELPAALAAEGHRWTDADLGPFHEAGDLLYGGPWLADRAAALAEVLDQVPEGLEEVVATVVAGGRRYRGTEVFAAMRRLGELQRDLAPFWAQADVLVVPTVPWLPTLAEVADDPIGTNARLGRNTTFANLLGLAAIAVPGGGVPGGVTVLAPAAHLGAVATIAAAITGEALPAHRPEVSGRIEVAVVGAHLRGQPLNHQLTDRGGQLVATTTTSASYRLYRLAGGPPLRPALERVGGCGRPIEVEVWSLPPAGLGELVADVAPPLGIGSIELADGRWVKGFVCETIGLAEATDITAHGGWRRYLSADG